MQRKYIYSRGHILYDIYTEEPLTEFHIPKQVTYHNTWKMYNSQTELQALYADEESEMYETREGALYNKKTKYLLYVPRGKRSLHISNAVRGIGYQAIRAGQLDICTIDPENPYLKLEDGNIYDHKKESLEAVISGEGKLYIPASVTQIAKDVLEQLFTEIEVAEGNPIYWAKDGVLGKGNHIEYICPQKTSVHIPANVTRFPSEFIRESMLEVTVDEEHPCFCVKEHVVYNKDCTEIVYFPCKREELVILGTAKFKARTFAKVSPECQIRIRLDERRVVSLPKKKTGAKAFTTCINYLNGADAEVKPGTEAFFADIFLMKWDKSERFERNIRMSTWQIIKKIIEEDDYYRMYCLIQDGRLFPRRNSSYRAMEYAEACGRMMIYEMIQNSRGIQIP